MLESSAIQPSQSLWCNAIVLVRKKDRGLWFCIDFCCLNAHMKKDSYPLPRIQDALVSVVGAGHYVPRPQIGVLANRNGGDIKVIYCLHSRQFGIFKCNCMPFGLYNALAMFQRLMQNCLSELNLIYCLIYLDDIIIFLWTVEEHLHRLCVVFDQFREYNLKFKPSKCSLFKEEINYLAHWVSKEGVQPSNLNWEAIAECAPPQTYMEIEAFLGLVGHYWKFIKGFVHYHTTGEQTHQEKGPVENWNGCCYWKMPWESLQCSETGMYECPSPSLC